MVADFLHGIRVTEVDSGPRPVQPIRTAVIGMIGVSDPRSFEDPTLFSVNELKLVANARDAISLFGSNYVGANLPKMLDAWLDHGAGVVFAINVFDPTIHKRFIVYETTFGTTGDLIDRASLGHLLEPDYATLTVNARTAVTDETVTLTNLNASALAGAGYLLEGSATVTNDDGTITYREGYDYTINYAVTPGTITRTEWGGINSGDDVLVSYVHLGTAFATPADYTVDSTDPENVQLVRINLGAITAGATVLVRVEVGSTDAVPVSDYIGTTLGDNSKTGSKLFETCYPLFGFNPVLFISDKSTDKAFKADYEALAEKLKGFAIFDAPIGANVTEAINGRGVDTGFVQTFFSSSDRAIACYPHLKVYDTVLDAERLEPLSWRMAALWCRRMVNQGFWWSPSNQQILGITGIEAPLIMSLTDSTAENQLLNEAGIVTVYANFGTGYRLWGNRSMQWPSDSFPDNFLPIRLTADVIHRSLERACLPFVDRPITLALIDAIKETVNGFFNDLINRGALVGGECTFDATKNSVQQIALGKLVFDIKFMPPPPAELIEFESFIDINYLNNLLGGNTEA